MNDWKYGTVLVGGDVDERVMFLRFLSRKEAIAFPGPGYGGTPFYGMAIAGRRHERQKHIGQIAMYPAQRYRALR